MFKRLGIGILFAMVMTLGAQATTLKVIGSTTCQNVFLLPAAPGLKKQTGIDLQVEGIGSVKGVIGLLKGDAKVSATSEAMAMAVASAKILDPGIDVPNNLIFHEITKDNIVIISHASNKVNFLEPEQIRDIYTGKITNWKEVGGDDAKVRPIVNRRGSGTEDTFYRAIMMGEDYGDKVSKTTNTRTIMRSVSRDKNAIGITSLRLARGNSKINIIKTRDISRSMGLITIGKPVPEVQKLIDYLRSPEGKKLYE